MVNDAALVIPEGFDSQSQRIVGAFVAGLQDQSRLLRERVADWPLAALEWQPQQGINTAGMLLAHLAFAEVAWLCVVAQGLPLEPEGRARFREIMGHDWHDDGLSESRDFAHPRILEGRSIAFYFALLDRGRAASLGVLRDWRDESIEQVVRTQTRTVTRGWVLYHLLQHFAHHAGQIATLERLMRLQGVLSAAPDD